MEKILEILGKIIKENPNDYDLGSKIRKFYNENLENILMFEILHVPSFAYSL